MNKIIILFISILIPFQVFAMDPITDDEMNNITGAVGVHIYVEGEDSQPAYQMLQWQNHRQRKKTDDSGESVNHAIQDIYEISYDNCELSLDKGKTNQNGLWINGKEAVTANRSFVKIGDPLTAPEISSDDIQLNFKDGNSLGSVESGDISVSIPQAPDAIYISPR